MSNHPTFAVLAIDNPHQVPVKAGDLWDQGKRREVKHFTYSEEEQLAVSRIYRRNPPLTVLGCLTQRPNSATELHLRATLYWFYQLNKVYIFDSPILRLLTTISKTNSRHISFSKSKRTRSRQTSNFKTMSTTLGGKRKSDRPSLLFLRKT